MDWEYFQVVINAEGRKTPIRAGGKKRGAIGHRINFSRIRDQRKTDRRK